MKKPPNQMEVLIGEKQKISEVWLVKNRLTYK